MKMELSDHAGEISEHNSFDQMARCLRDSADAVVRGNQTYVPENAIHRLKHVVLIMLDRLALIEGTNGAQWDDFLPQVPSQRPVVLRERRGARTGLLSNVLVEVAPEAFTGALVKSAITNVMCTAGLGPRAYLADVDYDFNRDVVALRFYDPDRSGVVSGTNIRVDQTDERIELTFESRDRPLESHVGAALDWLKEDCNHEAAAMERIDTLTRYFGLVRR